MEEEKEESAAAAAALLLCLPYLPLYELLSMSKVSKSLRDAVKDDVLAWLHLVVEPPLSMRLTDQFLFQITAKAHGRLRTLSLLACHRISDHALLQVVTSNPLLTKLYVPSCTGLTPEGVLKAVATLTANPNTKTFTRLKINGIYNIKKEDLLTLESFMPKISRIKTRFYHKYWTSSFLSIDEDDRSIDVEICPKCEEVELVFDCPTETGCRGCLQCIPRCEACGKCVSKEDEDEVGETLCNDIVCLNCWLCLPKCNHCNKPICPRHTHGHGQVKCSGSHGFVCEVCQEKSLETYWQY